MKPVEEPDAIAHGAEEMAAPRNFLGARHDAHARRTLAVLLLCAATMVVEVVGGVLFHSLVLLAEGLHMATHAGVMLIAAMAYRLARRHLDDPRFAFGTGKFGDLAAFASAVVLAATACAIAAESVDRMLEPGPIAFGQAIPVAVLGLVVNLVSIWLLHDDEHAHHGHSPDHDHDHDHDHGGHRAHGDAEDHHHDHNLRAAYVHVIADAAVGVLAIIGLVAARATGWLWLDPALALVGAYVILRWAWALARAAGSVLLDRVPDAAIERTVRARLEGTGARVRALHLWRLGPGHHGLVASLGDTGPRTSADYRRLLADLPTLSHVVIEVEPGR